ncbi:MAG: MerR family transcriptional regulator [Clostridia bacterium]
MEYSINKLAILAGISTRTLRYYDEIKLLRPVRNSTSGYRIYGETEVNLLQQILFFRELALPLEKIKVILSSPDFNEEQALQEHLLALRAKKEQLEKLILNAEKSILARKGLNKMTNEEKFAGLKDQLITENEEKYGAEIREKYGEEQVDASYSKLKKMSPADMAKVEALSLQVNETLQAAMLTDSPAGELAQAACALHQEWLMHFWQNYSKEAHLGLAQMYVEDPRFTEYYDKIAPGCALFLRAAIEVYCAN